LEVHAQTGRRTALSDLQPTARFCTRWSGVAADAVVQRARRDTTPETKRRYQLGMTDQVRQAVEKTNEKHMADAFMTFGPMRKRKERRLSVTN